MLESIAIILIILWILGLVSSYTLGGFIHILLVIAVIVIILRVIQGRRVLAALDVLMQRGIGRRAQSPGLCLALSGALSEAGL